MPYVYQIINKVNGKSYIGKTSNSIERRWKEHCNDRLRYPERALYRAINKYGVESFSIQVLEEVPNDSEACLKEKYWIKKLGTFKNGYNSTIGGDGKSFIDYDLVVETYRQCQNRTLTASLLNISMDSVTNILTLRKETILSSQEVSRLQYGKMVNMYSLTGEYIRTFSSIREAGQYLIDNRLTGCKLTTIKQHISEVCRGKRKTIARYIWKFA